MRSTVATVAPFVAQQLPALTQSSPAGGERAGRLQVFALDSPTSGALVWDEPADLPLTSADVMAFPAAAGFAATEPSTVRIVWNNGTSFGAQASPVVSGSTPVVSLFGSLDPVVDALSRALGVATTTPRFGPAWYWLLVWIADLVRLPESTPIDALEAARWHPGLDPDELSHLNLTSPDPASPDPASPELIQFCLDRLYEHARITGWAGIRADAMEGWLELGSISPEAARWHDAGSFSRELERTLDSPAIKLAHVCLTGVCRPGAEALLAAMARGLTSMRALDAHQGHCHQ